MAAEKPTGDDVKRDWILSSLLSVLAVLAMACGGPAQTPTLLPPLAPSETVIAFSDMALEQAIRDALGAPSLGAITAGELSELTTLNRPPHEFYGDISDLTSVEHLVNLMELDISGTPPWPSQISDLSPLASLSNLTTLNIEGRRIEDLSPLATMTNLTTLNLGFNWISDLSSLASLTNLTRLTLEGNVISDLSPLADLTSLRELNLAANQVSDLSPLANLKRLRKLNLAANQISDLSALANLSNLTELQLWGNQIIDLSPLLDNDGLGAGDTIWLLNHPSRGPEDVKQLETRKVKVVTDYDFESLIGDLRRSGATVEELTGQPSMDLFSVESRYLDSRAIEFNGTTQLYDVAWVFEFPDDRAADRAAGNVSPDGYNISTADGHGLSHIEWIAPPNFYKKGRLIVLYVGDDSSLIKVLRGVLGPEVAGG